LPEQLAGYIAMLESACERNPESPDLRTCLGMAYAMNFDAYRSMDALEAAVRLDPRHFWAQLKYAELHYRLRALPQAERETLKALELARNGLEMALARQQLRETRRLLRDGSQKPEWTKSLKRPALALVLTTLALSLAIALR
jgi:tetratricopeptide (TPR) repeat protein